MKTTILKWGYLALGAAFGVMLCMIAHEVFAQTCSPIGQFVYCDSSEGSTIIAPVGKDRGIIMGPGNRQGTYSAPAPSTYQSKQPARLYFDYERPQEDRTRLPSFRFSEPDPAEMGIDDEP